jgi:hypothetical protein
MLLWPKRPLHRVLVVLGGLFLGLAVVDQLWVSVNRRLTIDTATTHITGPLSPDGVPDYLAALNAAHAQGVTTANNAAIPLWETLGDLADSVDTAAIYRAWGVPQPAEAGKLLSFHNWAVQNKVAIPPAGSEAIMFDGVNVPAHEDPCDWEEQVSREGPWSAAAHPLLARWQAQLDPLLNQVQAAVQRPRYYMPLVTPDGMTAGASEGAVLRAMMPKLGVFRECANAMLGRAMARLEAGDVAGFSRDVLSCQRLSRLLAQQPDLITHLVAMGIDALTMNTVQAASVSGRLSAKDADSLRAELDRLGPMPSPAHAIDEGERYVLLDALCTARNGSSGAEAIRAVHAIARVVPLNFSAAMRRVNTRMDRLVAAFELPEFARRREEFNACDEEIKAMAQREVVSRVWHAEDLPAVILSASLVRINVLATAIGIERDLALTALALRSLRAGGAPYPNTLAELKSFTPPEDRFTGKPLVYRKKGNGYVLYSLGENLKDDGGVRDKKSARNGDLAVEGTQ